MYLKHLFLLLFLSLSVLCTPAFADDDGDNNDSRDDARVYHFYDDVNIISTLKLRYGSHPHLFAKLVYPQLENSGDNEDYSEGINEFNLLTKSIVEDLVEQFKQDLSSEGKNSLYIDYNASGITGNEDHIISVRFSIQGMHNGMAHPTHYHRVLNFSIDYNEEIALSDLFLPNADYLSALANYSYRVLSRRLPAGSMIANGTAPRPENYRNWNLKPTGILITFDEYQVAPYVYGSQTVLIPYTVLKPLIAADAAISACVKSRNKCKRNNVLTGGFIDEAANTLKPLHGRLNPVLSKL